MNTRRGRRNHNATQTEGATDVLGVKADSVADVAAVALEEKMDVLHLSHDGGGAGDDATDAFLVDFS